MAKDNKTLHLVLKRKWWDMIQQGVKKEEYRSLSTYNIQRLCDMEMYDRHVGRVVRKPARKEYIEDWISLGYDVEWLLEVRHLILRDYTRMCFHLGYTNTTMAFRIDGITVGLGRKEWGAENGVRYFVISLGERIGDEKEH